PPWKRRGARVIKKRCEATLAGADGVVRSLPAVLIYSHDMANDGQAFHDKPLWAAKSQDERLRELLGDPAEIKEKPLRRDVRSLGRLLGNVIKEQEGQDLFETVEALRTLSIAGRAGQSSVDTRSYIVRRVTVTEATKLAKAFAIYFELTNLAETNHRKRRR